MAAPSPSERQLVAAVAAHTSWANTANRSQRTAPARAALDAKFLKAADGDPVRAAHLRKAHFARLTLKSIAARRRSKEASAAAAQADADLINLDAPGAGEVE